MEFVPPSLRRDSRDIGSHHLYYGPSPSHQGGGPKNGSDERVLLYECHGMELLEKRTARVSIVLSTLVGGFIRVDRKKSHFRPVSCHCCIGKGFAAAMCRGRTGANQ